VGVVTVLRACGALRSLMESCADGDGEETEPVWAHLQDNR